MIVDRMSSRKKTKREIVEIESRFKKVRLQTLLLRDEIKVQRRKFKSLNDVFSMYEKDTVKLKLENIELKKEYCNLSFLEENSMRSLTRLKVKCRALEEENNSLKKKLKIVRSSDEDLKKTYSCLKIDYKGVKLEKRCLENEHRRNRATMKKLRRSISDISLPKFKPLEKRKAVSFRSTRRKSVDDYRRDAKRKVFRTLSRRSGCGKRSLRKHVLKKTLSSSASMKSSEGKKPIQRKGLGNRDPPCSKKSSCEEMKPPGPKVRKKKEKRRKKRMMGKEEKELAYALAQAEVIDYLGLLGEVTNSKTFLQQYVFQKLHFKNAKIGTLRCSRQTFNRGFLQLFKTQNSAPVNRVLVLLMNYLLIFKDESLKSLIEMIYFPKIVKIEQMNNGSFYFESSKSIWTFSSDPENIESWIEVFESCIKNLG